MVQTEEEVIVDKPVEQPNYGVTLISGDGENISYEQLEAWSKSNGMQLNKAGGLLSYASKERVADEVKRLLDICAPGGGFIFETTSALSHVKRENVEAMFETVKLYGKY